MSTSLNKMNMIKYLVTFGIPVLILLIPTSEVYTREMAIVLAATFCFLAWAAFELTDLLIPALLWPAVLILSGSVTYGDVFGVFVGSDIVGCAAVLVLAGILDSCGLLRRLAFFVARKFGGSFTGTVYSVFASTFAIALVTFACGDAVTAAITFGAVKAFGLFKKPAGAVMMMAGMLGGVTMRMIIFYPFFVNGMIRSVQTVNPDFTMTQMDLLIYNWPILIFCIAFIWIMIKFFVKKEDVAHLNSKSYYDEEYAKLGPISKNEKVGIAVLLFIVLSIFTYSWHGFDYMFSFVIGIAIMFLFGGGKKEDIQACPLGFLFFFASCMAIGSVCAAVGITAALTNVLSSLMNGLGEITSLLSTILIGFGLNFCMTPMAMCAGFTGMIYEIASAIGITPMAGVMAFYFSTDMVLLPYEFLSFLLFFVYGAMTTKDFAKFHAIKCVLFVIFFIAVFVPYWKFAGLM